jgi:hypothetical protein
MARSRQTSTRVCVGKHTVLPTFVLNGTLLRDWWLLVRDFLWVNHRAVNVTLISGWKRHCIAVNTRELTLPLCPVLQVYSVLMSIKQLKYIKPLNVDMVVCREVWTVYWPQFGHYIGWSYFIVGIFVAYNFQIRKKKIKLFKEYGNVTQTILLLIGSILHIRFIFHKQFHFVVAGLKSIDHGIPDNNLESHCIS